MAHAVIENESSSSDACIYGYSFELEMPAVTIL